MDLTKLLDFSETNLDLETVITNFLVTFILAWIIYIVYRMTYKGVAYSKNFNISIVLTSLVTAMVMMVIGNNLALSLGMVGALSIVRFRAAIKEPKDIAFIFWGISVGLAAGTGAYSIAVIGTILITIVAIIFNLNIGGETKSYILMIKGNQLDDTQVDATVKSMTKSYKLRMSNTNQESGEIVYEIRLGKITESKLIASIKELPNIKSVNIVAYNGQITG